MSSSTQYKVYLRKTGDSRKAMRAQFAELVDAVNYASAEANGRYKYNDSTLLVIGPDGRKVTAYKAG